MPRVRASRTNACTYRFVAVVHADGGEPGTEITKDARCIFRWGA